MTYSDRQRGTMSDPAHEDMDEYQIVRLSGQEDPGELSDATPRLVTVADKEGVVGGFWGERAALEAVRGFSGTAFVLHRWPSTKSDACPNMWVLPYKDNQTPAYASTARDEVVRAQRALLPLDLVDPDDVDYWEAPVGEITPAAARRLAPAVPRGDDPERLFLDMVESGGAPAETAPAETAPAEKMINLLESVVQIEPA